MTLWICQPGHPLPGDAEASRAPAVVTGDPAHSPRAVLTVFYNGDCPVCLGRVLDYQMLSAGRSRLIAWCDVAQAPWALRRWQVEGVTARRRIHAADAGGRLYSGAAAFARLWRELPGYRWLGWMIALPGMGLVAELVYRRAAARAFACRDPARRPVMLHHV